jgi:cob(I)alamin adenosyltransferase
MKRLCFTFLLILFVAALSARTVQNEQIDSLLKVLDETIKNRPVVDKNKELQLSNIKKELARTPNLEKKFDLYGQLFEIYKSYQMDSAAYVASKRKEIAALLTNKSHSTMASLNYAEVMMMTGMYKEALDIIKMQKENHEREEVRAYIFHLYHSSYLLMSEFSFSSEEKAYYKGMVTQYKDSILSILAKDNIGYFWVKSSQLVEQHKYSEALRLAREAYARSIKDNHSIAVSANSIADVYSHIGDQEAEKRFLIISSIADINSGVKEYISLRKLAGVLYAQGDIDRAYLYIKRCMEDAIFCNARFRTFEISQMLPIINGAYDQKIKKEKRNLVLGITLISLLSLIVIGCFVFTYQQLLALAKARRALKEINKDLQLINKDLTAANSKLSESNHVKEEYIGYVFTMCSDYIDKMEDFRKKVNRKVKAGQIEELQKLSSSTTFVSDELRAFYNSFDSVFLNLYPDFVEEFNSLLLPNEQIVIKANDLLTPELRIFALVRLGINDSTKIAEFLHYSPQTVYNYRLKVRGKAKATKEDFSIAVGRIGQIKR